MANPATAPEPSMEEILASIRQIISEDSDGTDKTGTSSGAGTSGGDASGDAAASSPDKDPAAPVKANVATEVSSSTKTDERDMDASVKADLAKAQDAFSSKNGSAGVAASSGDAGADGEKDANAVDDPDEQSADVFAIEPDSDSDVKESTSMAMPVQSKQQSSAPSEDDILLSDDSQEVVHGAFSALAHTILAQNARTLEDLVTEMLQPMLKGWLDDNLPSLVERLVKEEIDRVSRGRR